MAKLLFEQKVRYLGAWQNQRVDNQVIDEINSQIQHENGNKATLQLSTDGFRLVKNTLVQGRMLQDFTPLEKIQFVTVSQRMPNILMIISVGKDQQHRYQVNVYKCSSGLEAGKFTQLFQSIHRTVRPVKVVTAKPVVNAQEDEINWTLRSKDQDNSKRELKRMVDIQGQKAVVHANGDVIRNETTIVQNGHTEQYDNGVRIPLYRKGKATRLSTDSDERAVEVELDNRSESSESALRMDLDSLSQEVRDLKLRLEKSTGAAYTSSTGSPHEYVVKLNTSHIENKEDYQREPAGVKVYSYGGAEDTGPGEFKPMNVTVHTHTIKPETVVVKSEEHQQNGTVIVEGEPVQMRNKGYHVDMDGKVAEVRVAVPDYRTPAERSSEIEVTTPRTEQRESGYRVTSRPVSTSYDEWKRNTLERNAVIKYHDGPERLRWNSQSSRTSHYVTTTRPRSALPSWSTDVGDGVQYMEVRRQPIGVGHYHHSVKHTPNHYIKGGERKTQSLRMKGLSTTVARPIERVYTGRPDAKHRSLSYRPHSASLRPSIIVKDEHEYVSPQGLHVETNNNVVKVDPSDTEPLDVSGIDLYKETHIDGAVIRT